jgi:hypothetical protein
LLLYAPPNAPVALVDLDCTVVKSSLANYQTPERKKKEEKEEKKKKKNSRHTPVVNDPEYRRSLKDWESFATSLTDKIIEVDETVPELPFKDINFRIYRDIRFSKNPAPYKVRWIPSQPSPA